MVIETFAGDMEILKALVGIFKRVIRTEGLQGYERFKVF